LEPLTLDPADFQSDLPEQRWHLAHADEALGLYVGVWTTTDMQEAFGPYPGDEFMVVLEGAVEMLDADGNATTISEGEAFCVHNKTPTSWRQVGPLAKYFMIFDDPSGDPPRRDDTAGGIVRFDVRTADRADAPAAVDAGLVVADGAAAPMVFRFFTNYDGRMASGIWRCEAFEASEQPHPRHELLHVVEGRLSLLMDGGDSLSVGPGEAVFIPKGARCGWRADGPVRAYYAACRV
jgi:hypothetical protein